MREKIRVLQDGKRLVVVFEDVDDALLKVVHQLIGAALPVTGLDVPPSPEVSASELVSKKEPSPVQTVQSPSIETTPQPTPSEPQKQTAQPSVFHFPAGKKHAGETVLEVVQSGDLSYLCFLLTKIKYRFRDSVIRDFFTPGVAAALQQYAVPVTKEQIKDLFSICDSVKGGDFSQVIFDSLGVTSLDEALKGSGGEYLWSSCTQLLQHWNGGTV